MMLEPVPEAVAGQEHKLVAGAHFELGPKVWERYHPKALVKRRPIMRHHTQIHILTSGLNL
jgi:hypothetical protein